MIPLAAIFLAIHAFAAAGAFALGVLGFQLARVAHAEPMPGLASLRLMRRIELRVLIPAALAMPASSLLLIWSEGLDFNALGAAQWPRMSASLYLAVLALAVLAHLPRLDRAIELAGELAVVPGPGAGELGILKAAGGLAHPVHVAGHAAGAEPQAGEAPAVAAADPRRHELLSLAHEIELGGAAVAVVVTLIVILVAGRPAL